MTYRAARRRFIGASSTVAAALLSACREQSPRAQATGQGGASRKSADIRHDAGTHGPPLAAGTTPEQVGLERPAGHYPPALTGLRGDAQGSNTAAHGLAFGGQLPDMPGAVSERYDLVVVGAGLSGLAAAFLYRKARPDARILIVDNHDDFGGHAQRNEFRVDGRLLITYAGSESLFAPASNFSRDVHGLLEDLGVDYRKLGRYFQQDLYEGKRGLGSGVFFSEAVFGRAAVVPQAPDMEDARQAAAAIARFPLPEADRRALVRLYTDPDDHLRGKGASFAERTSYHDFLKTTVGLSDRAVAYLNDLCTEDWARNGRALSVSEAWSAGLPGTQNLGLEGEVGPDGDLDDRWAADEPYIYHFPDGNASIARLLVRRLIPAAAPGHTMEDIVLAPFDYGALDRPGSPVRLRLGHTVLRIENRDDGVAVACTENSGGQLRRSQAKQCIFAGHAALAARIMPGLPGRQHDALAGNIRGVMLYAKVALKNTRAFQKLGVHELYAPASPYVLLKLDEPVSMGGYRCPQTADEPAVLHGVRVYLQDTAPDARLMQRGGRAELLALDHEQLEAELREQLRAVFALAGENADEAIAAMTINRWAHGYSYFQARLWDSDQATRAAIHAMQQPAGQIFLAGSDTAQEPYLHGAIDQAVRAVNQALQA